MIEISKNVKIGDLVTLRGNKYIRCNGKSKPCGVYVAGMERTVITYPDGVIERQKLTGGIQTWGVCSVNLFKADKKPRYPVGTRMVDGHRYVKMARKGK